MNVTKKIFALGFFDGVHRGHRALLQQCVALARELAMELEAARKEMGEHFRK